MFSQHVRRRIGLRDECDFRGFRRCVFLASLQIESQIVRAVTNVDNPITINQCYSTPADVCAQFPSTLSISDVHCKYRCVQRRHEADVLVSVINVTGTSSGKEGDVVVDIECSAQCVDITATGTQITSPKGPSVYVCANVESENQVR